MPKESKGVRLDHISKIYKDPKTGKDFYAVHDVSLDIQPGSFVVSFPIFNIGHFTPTIFDIGRSEDE